MHAIQFPAEVLLGRGVEHLRLDLRNLGRPADKEDLGFLATFLVGEGVVDDSVPALSFRQVFLELFESSLLTKKVSLRYAEYDESALKSTSNVGSLDDGSPWVPPLFRP